jgi:hypothetical protein
MARRLPVNLVSSATYDRMGLPEHRGSPAALRAYRLTVRGRLFGYFAECDVFRK